MPIRVRSINDDSILRRLLRTHPRDVSPPRSGRGLWPVVACCRIGLPTRDVDRIRRPVPSWNRPPRYVSSKYRAPQKWDVSLLSSVRQAVLQIGGCRWRKGKAGTFDERFPFVKNAGCFPVERPEGIPPPRVEHTFTRIAESLGQ